MLKMTCNKSNWTGESCEVIITDPAKKLFTIGMEGYTFQMLHIPDDEIEAFKVVCIEAKNWEWLGIRFGEYVHFFQETISREDKSEYCAFAQLAWNVI